MIRQNLKRLFVVFGANLIVFLVQPMVWALNHSGDITVDTTWAAIDSPHVITDHVTVHESATLTIEAGSEIQFHSGKDLNILGILIAKGNAQSRIIFTSDPNLTPALGLWGSIRFLSSANTQTYLSEMEYVDIRYGTYGVWQDIIPVNLKHCRLEMNVIGVMLTNGPKPTIENSIFYRNGNGVSALGSDSVTSPPEITVSIPTLTNNHFYGQLGYAVYSYPTDSSDLNNPAYTINAQNNWWGTQDAAKMATLMHDNTVFARSQPMDYSNEQVVGEAVFGLIQTATTWELTQSPYVVVENVVVNAGTTLTIEPGVRLQFDGPYSLVNEGTLISQGTQAQRITFTSHQANPQAGDWMSLHLKVGSQSVMDYFDLEYATHGLFQDGVSADVTRATFSNNVIGLLLKTGSSPRVSLSSITHNQYGLIISGDTVQPSQPLLINNNIHTNALYNIQTESTSGSLAAVSISAKYNWWATTDAVAIEASIFDDDENNQLPSVHVMPFADGLVQEQIEIQSPYEGLVTQSEHIAVSGTFAGVWGAQVMVNDVPAMVEGNRFIATGVELSQMNANTITAKVIENNMERVNDQLTVRYVGDVSAAILVDDFEDGVADVNQLGFRTSDEQTTAISVDVNGAHQIIWDDLTDYWHTDFFDLQQQPKGTDAGVFSVLSFHIKGDNGGEDLTIELEDISHGVDFNKTVRLSDITTVTTSWQKVMIPLFAFTKQGVWKTQLRSLVFLFDQQASGSIQIDDIKLVTALIDDFKDGDAAHNRLGFATTDDGSLIENIDISGYHTLSWDQNTDVWRSYLWDQSFAWDATGFTHVALDIKGQTGGEQLRMYVKDDVGVGFVNLNSYTNLTNQWQRVSVPLSDFSGQGIQLRNLTEIGLKFDIDSSGSISIDNFQFTQAHAGHLLKTASQGPVQIKDKRLQVAGQPFVIKGVNYQPTPIGLDLTTPLLFSDTAIYQRDLPNLRAMGANTIRTWIKVNDVEFLDAAYNNGVEPVYVIMGFPIDPLTDLSDPTERNVIKADFSQYVTNYMNHPAVLMWALGNEENLFYQGAMSDWYSLANELAEIAYNLEGNNYHPVAIVNGDLEHIGDALHLADDDSLPFVDVWGVNGYRGFSYRSFFQTYREASAKPVWISEFGADSWHTLFAGTPSNGYDDPITQGQYYVNNWQTIIAEPASLGGSLMEYSDEWWKAIGESYLIQNHEGLQSRYDQPDDYANEEFWGLYSLSSGPSGLDVLTAKASLAMVKSAYRMSPEVWWPTRFEFNRDDDLEGFSPLSGVDWLDVRDGLLVLAAGANDVSLLSPDDLVVDAQTYSAVQWRMRVTNATAVNLSFKTSTETSIPIGRQQSLAVISDGQFHEYSLDFRQHPDWSGIISQLQWDVMDVQNAHVEIDYIRFTAPGPTLTVNGLQDGDYVNTPQITINGTVDDITATIEINGITVTNQNGTFSQIVNLSEGHNSLTIMARNVQGVLTQQQYAVILDTTAPQLQIIAPLDGTVTNQSTIDILGTVSDSHLLTLDIDGIPMPANNGSFVLNALPLTLGSNTIVATATDAAGNSAVETIIVHYDLLADFISITAPTDQTVTNQSQITVSGDFQGAPTQITINGVIASMNGTTFSAMVPLPIEGANDITAVMSVAAGGPYTDTITVNKDTLPPTLIITTPTDGDTIRGY